MQRVVGILCRTHQVYSTRVYRTISKLLSARNGICTGLLQFTLWCGRVLSRAEFLLVYPVAMILWTQ